MARHRMRRLRVDEILEELARAQKVMRESEKRQPDGLSPVDERT